LMLDGDGSSHSSWFEIRPIDISPKQLAIKLYLSENGIHTTNTSTSTSSSNVSPSCGLFIFGGTRIRPSSFSSTFQLTLDHFYNNPSSEINYDINNTNDNGQTTDNYLKSCTPSPYPLAAPGVVLDERGNPVLLGGYHEEICYQSTLRYHPSHDQFEFGPSLPTPLCFLTAHPFNHSLVREVSFYSKKRRNNLMMMEEEEEEENLSHLSSSTDSENNEDWVVCIGGGSGPFRGDIVYDEVFLMNLAFHPSDLGETKSSSNEEEDEENNHHQKNFL